ncbi:MAG: hypothetical protein DRJ38_09855 [Thermoprotei archaeon]|nr:MAG: hypothetical protein DRJ38_09855 [Thermoprotei archaeon]
MKKRRWKEVAKTLKEDERKVYQAIIEAGGIIEQSELPEKQDFPKASVSRALDLLESKELVERNEKYCFAKIIKIIREFKVMKNMK